MDRIIEVDSLSKSYGEIRAVDKISFHVAQGQLFAFLGPNGAGKSTTIDMICTFLKPDSGRAVIDGHELGRADDKIRSAIGAVFQDGMLDPLLTVRENILIRAGFYHASGARRKSAAEEAIRAAGVGEYADRRYGRLSGGQRRRADIARALVNRPKILFLDEPTTGLDPRTRREVWDSIKKLRDGAGMTVFLTTHYMEEAAGADYVNIIDGGKIAAHGTPDSLRDKYAGDYLRISPSDRAGLEALLAQKDIAFDAGGGRLTIRLEHTRDAIAILKLCEEKIDSFEVVNGTMDDAFLAITGRNFEK